MSVDPLFDMFLNDPEHGEEQWARVAAAKRGNRDAYESIFADFKAWKEERTEQLIRSILGE